MQYRRLGRTDLTVSALGLGTMTWGEQNTPEEAHAQLDLAVEHGVNLIDTAEMYPVPPRAETQGQTEDYLGRWLRRRGRTDDLVIASKITGPSRGFPWIRAGATRFVREHLHDAVDGSLRRLGLDRIDLYQLHWPDRSTNFFGSLEYTHRPDAPMTPPDEVLRGLEDLVTSGKVRHVGVSNETPWGVMRFLALSEQHGLPRISSIQNPYSLLNRSFEIGLAEIAHREDCGLLAYSPLAMGVLSGKYEGGRTRPPEARLTKFARFTRYATQAGLDASERYVTLARQHDLDPSQMALAWVTSRPFVTSNLLGATTLEQLRTNLGSAEVTLSDEVIAGIQAIHEAHPNPCP